MRAVGPVEFVVAIALRIGVASNIRSWKSPEPKPKQLLVCESWPIWEVLMEEAAYLYRSARMYKLSNVYSSHNQDNTNDTTNNNMETTTTTTTTTNNNATDDAFFLGFVHNHKAYSCTSESWLRTL
jgi:predicted RNA polymerase sigma factor